jgi:hypothetical protein
MFHPELKLPEHNMLAEVAGSNPTQFIFINLVNYGIELSSFLTHKGYKIIRGDWL